MKQAFIVILLACTLAVCTAEPSATREEKCMLDMSLSLQELYKKFSKGMEPAIIEHLIRTDTTISGAARWLLVKALRNLEFTQASGHPLTLGEHLSDSLTLCKRPPTADDELPLRRERFGLKNSET